MLGRLLRSTMRRVRASAAAARAVTPAGRGTLLLGVIGLLLGSWLHWVEATTLAFVCLGALLLAVPQLWRSRPASVELRLQPATTVAGRTAEAVVSVRAGRLPLVHPLVTVPLAARRATMRLRTVRGHDKHEERFEIPASRRGVYPVGPVTLVASDLLGLVRRTVTWAGPTELLVHPRTVELGSISTGVVSDLEGAPSQQLSKSDLAFHALREYTPGDDLRHVHWRASARASTLLVRQYVETTRSHATVVLDDDPGSYSGGSAFELAISVAASIAVRATLEDFEVTWITGPSDITSRDPKTLLDASSRLKATGHDVVEAARRTASAVAGTSMVVVVSGDRSSPSALRMAAAAFSADARRVVVRAEPRGQSRLSDLGGIRSVAVAELAHLPALLIQQVG